MKPLLLAMAAVAALGLSACGGDEAAPAGGPLTIEQRVPSEQDAPGSKPDPVETEKPVSVSGADEFVSKLGERFVNPPPEDIAKFKSSGFLRAFHDTRFIPASIGGAHTRSAPHIFSLVMQFESEDGANTAVDLLHADSVRPCPTSCAEQATEFDVSDIPNSQGTHRYATAESIESTGDKDGTPFDLYEIGFADGPFAYRIQLRGPPGKVSQDQAEKIAKSLYDRVKGAPVKG